MQGKRQTPSGVLLNSGDMIQTVPSFMSFENMVDIDSPVHDIRTEAIKHFENEGFPTKRQEAWKYTSLNAVLKHDYSVFPKHEEALDLQW